MKYNEVFNMFNMGGVGIMENGHLLTVRSFKRKIVENLVSLRVPFGNIQTEVEIEKTGKDRACIKVNLPEAKRSEKALRITLKKNKREISSFLSDSKLILFEDIPFGHYSISLIEDEKKIGEYFFEIRETSHER
ncbi:MAG: hypothetical protein ACMUIU_12715 [bacterium]